MEAVENLKEKQRSHADITKRLEEAEAAMNKPSEKERIIQDQANLIKGGKRLLKCLRRKSGLMQRWRKG